MKKGLIMIAFLIPCLMMAQISFGVRAGLAKPKDIDATLTAGIWLGSQIMPKLAIGIEGDYWSKEFTGYHMQDISLAAIGKFTLVDAPVKVRPGAGLGVHMFSNGSSTSKLAAHFLFEFGYRLNRNMSLIAQAKYAHIFQDPSIYVMYGTVGVVYNFASANE